MAELVIRSVSGSLHSLHAHIGEGRAAIYSVDVPKSSSNAELAVRGYDASCDLVYAIPNGTAIDRDALAWELDLHIPVLLSLQTDTHWFASSIPGYVMIQPIEIHESVASPLESLRAIATSLAGDNILLQCDESSMLAIECLNEEVVIQSAGVGIAEFASMNPTARDRIISLRKECHILLSGADVTQESFAQLIHWRSHAFERIGPQHLLACADIDVSALTAMNGHEGEFALLIGAAAAFAIEHAPLLVVR